MDNPAESLDGDTSRAQIVLSCSDLDATLAFFTGQLGFRLDMIMPADAPRIAAVSGHGITLRLETSGGAPIAGTPFTLRLLADHAHWERFGTRVLCGPDGMHVELVDHDAPPQIPEGVQTFVISRAADHRAWSEGRAGMQYRDLIPGRLGGRCIASHIRIPQGGEVPDYVHYHKVRFQMIYCKTGWVRVVYEDQGPPFVMHAGDCVLQPPGIRHRVLENSPGLEVIEVGCPAVHETLCDHGLQLPTAQTRPGRLFDGQRFVHHVAADAAWESTHDTHWKYLDAGFADATDGLASARVLRSSSASETQRADTKPASHTGEFLFLFVLGGALHLTSRALGMHDLDVGDACTIPSGADYALDSATPCEILEIALPAKMA